MNYRRCGDSGFYWATDAKTSGRNYVDPVDLAWVTAARFQEAWLVTRIVIERLEPEEVMENFGKPEASMLLRWSLRVMDARTKGGKGWKNRLLDDLDVDTYERDRLLDVIGIFVMESVADQRSDVQRKTLEVPGTIEARNDALRHFGVPLCI